MSPALLPIDVDSLGAVARWKARVPQLVWGFVILGTVIRLVEYLLRFPLWVDECMLAENFLDRGFLDLHSPLANHQVAPIGFLWVECACLKVFGFSEWSLRLFPLFCGIASLLVFRRLASHLLAGAPLVLAVGCLAVAKGPIGLSANCKPYATDLLVAVTLLALAVEWLRRPRQTGWLWGLAAFIPLGLALSFPAVFVAGAISLGLLVPVYRCRSRVVWGAYIAYHIALCAAFAVVFTISCGPEFHELQAFMEEYWSTRSGFPPLRDPWQLAVWFVNVHLGETLFAVPYGAENGGGAICLLCCLVAAVVMYRRGQGPVLTMLLATFGLAFVAATINRYPYGGHHRLMQFVVPAICLAAGLGAATGVSWIERLGGRRILTEALALTQVLFGMGVCGRALLRPYHFAPDNHHRKFVREFWREDPGSLTICCRTDLARELAPGGAYSYYLCNQRIYSAPHRAGRRLTAAAIELIARPVRLVVYAPPREALDLWEVAECLKLFEPGFEFAGHEEFQLPLTDDGYDHYGRYRVFRFVPRSDPTQPRFPGELVSNYRPELP